MSSLESKFGMRHEKSRHFLQFCYVRRRLHKQEIVKLSQQLKTVSVSTKGGEKESDRLKKELDKARCDAYITPP